MPPGACCVSFTPVEAILFRMADEGKGTLEMKPARKGPTGRLLPGRRDHARSKNKSEKFFETGWTVAIPALGSGWGIITLIYVLQLPGGVRWTVFATAVLIASSAFLIGGLVGFLFGVPRTVQGATPRTGATHYQGNTNLEQVSDWLTKIIVGVSLVEIGHVIPGLTRLAESMKAPLGGKPSSESFGLALTIANALLGFFLFYLWSRSFFVKELEELEKSEERAQHVNVSSANDKPDPETAKRRRYLPSAQIRRTQTPRSSR
jgi:hypothetical protein